MSKKKVVITDSPFPSPQPFLDVLSELNCEVDFAELNNKEKFYNLCEEADGLIVTYADINKEVISHLKKCKILARTGVAVNNIAIAEATKNNIFVTNVITPQIIDVANHAITLLLNSVKRITLLNNYVKKGNWDFSVAVPIYQLKDRTLGLAGFGNIAREVTKRAKAFDIKVIVYDPYVSDDVCKEAGVEKVSFEELLKRSDYISIHMPLTSETKKLFSWKQFEKMKEGVHLINTSRGGIIDEDALIGMLERKKIAGAGLDVLATEFPSNDHPLYKYDNVIITPHSAYYSEECVRGLQICAASEVVRVLKGENPESVVNRELLSLI